MLKWKKKNRKKQILTHEIVNIQNEFFFNWKLTFFYAVIRVGEVIVRFFDIGSHFLSVMNVKKETWSLVN
jgi:hypothetical protein